MNNQNDILVSICCITYNQVSYIRQCLDGFIMQETNFKYEIIIHDDCSTDGTTEVVREYAEKYPNIIVPIIQEVNQYQHGIKRILATFVVPRAKGKYIAECEGDDYWIDPLKLQKQVDILEAHPDYSMVCNRVKLFSEKKNKFIGESYCYNKDQKVFVRDVIFRGGLFISTCSIVLRRTLFDTTLPEYILNCHVGDYPLQIYAAMHGDIYYINDTMSVYRIDNSHSWMGKQKMNSISPERIKVILSQVKMLDGFANDYPEYKIIFENKISQFINSNIPDWKNSKSDISYYINLFKSRIANYSFWWSLDLFVMKLRVPFFRHFYRKIFQRKFNTLYTHILS